MIVRQALPSDLGAIVAIYNAAIADGRQTADIAPVTVESRTAWFSSHDDKRYPLWVASLENRIAGYLTLSPYRAGRGALMHTAEVSCYLHKEYRRQGIGGKLLQHAMAYCPTVHIKTIFAIVIDTNLASISFFEKWGFSKWGHLPLIAEFDGIEAGHIYMGKRLAP